MSKPIAFTSKTFIRCGLCGKEVLVFLEQPDLEILKQVGNDEISTHIMMHYFENRLIPNEENQIRLKLVIDDGKN